MYIVFFFCFVFLRDADDSFVKGAGVKVVFAP